MTIGQAFEAILETQRIAEFKCAVHNGVVCIGTNADWWPRESETRAYDVRDLIDDYIAYDLHPSKPDSRNRPQPPTTQDCREAVNRITKWLDTRVSGRSYIDDVSEFAGRLFVTGPPELHDKIEHFLDELRQDARSKRGRSCSVSILIGFAES